MLLLHWRKGAGEARRALCLSPLAMCYLLPSYVREEPLAVSFPAPNISCERPVKKTHEEEFAREAAFLGPPAIPNGHADPPVASKNLLTFQFTSYPFLRQPHLSPMLCRRETLHVPLCHCPSLEFGLLGCLVNADFSWAP